MALYNLFRKKPPIYKRQPIATAAVILTLVGMFVLGPVGYLWNGMAEELKSVRTKVEVVQKEKVDNENLKATLNELKEQRKETREALKDQNKSIQTNQMAIEKILLRHELESPKGFGLKSTGKSDAVSKSKVALTPTEFNNYMDMTAERRVSYKKYLERTGKDVSGLP